VITPAFRHLEVDGARIWMKSSGLDDGPAVVLVHGSGANHAWWSAMLPCLEQRFHVTRMDLSGHGDSDHRRHGEYDMTSWAREVAAVVGALDRPALLVGHSMGGSVCIRAAELVPHLVAGVATFDTFGLDGTRATPPSDRPPRPARHYPTLEEIVGRFALVPPQPPAPPDVMDVVARDSVRRTPQGWTWKADQIRILPSAGPSTLDRVARLECPLLFVRAELSVFNTDGPLAAVGVARDAEEATIKGVHHHLVLEAPEECVHLVSSLADRVSR
jgi:pimeloyl-ACP methyl ester carboxylesterase